MAQSQSVNPYPTDEQRQLINDLEGHVDRPRVNEGTGHVIASLRPDDNFHGAYRAASRHDFDVSVYHETEYDLLLKFK